MPDAVGFSPSTGQPLFRVGLLTDIHIGNTSLLERQKKAFADMDALGLRLLCLMGDIVDNALEHQYAMARSLIGGLNTPILAITGNHELFPLTLPVETCLAHFRHGFGQPRHYTARRYDPYLFVFLGIDQRLPSLPKNRRDTGISQEQLDWFRLTLQQHAGLPTVVISHAPFEQTVADSDHFPLADSASLCDILADAPQVFLWLSGHTHLPDIHRGEKLQTAVEPIPGRHFVHVPSLADYYVHVVHGQRQFFRGLPLQTRLLACYPDRIEIETYDMEAQTVTPFVTAKAPFLRRQAAA
jgi:3',5'-cyclic AMP phosphodiesterase CpdA